MESRTRSMLWVGNLHELWSGGVLQARFEFDGDAHRTKKTDDFSNTIPAQTFYLHSTVLDENVAEIASDGTRTNCFVYADGEVIATLSSGTVFWQHRDPSNRSLRTTLSDGSVVGKVELDPMDVTVEDPFEPPRYHGGGGGGGRDAGGVEARVASLMNISTCDFAGMLVPCAMVGQFSELIHEAGPSQESLWYNPTGAFYFVVTPARKPPQLKPQPKKKPSKKEIERRKKRNGGVGKDELEPQNSGPVRLGGMDELKKLIEQTSSSCREAVQKLLSE